MTVSILPIGPYPPHPRRRYESARLERIITVMRLHRVEDAGCRGIYTFRPTSIQRAPV